MPNGVAYLELFKTVWYGITFSADVVVGGAGHLKLTKNALTKCRGACRRAHHHGSRGIELDFVRKSDIELTVIC